MLLRIALRVAPFLKVYWLIILEHFIISFCLLKHYITTLCCCQVVFLIIMLYKPYQLKHLNFPTYLFYTNRNCQLYLGSYNLRLPSPTFAVWNSLPIFDFAGLEPVTYLRLQNVFPITPSVNIISVFIHLTIIYMVTDMKIIIYFIKDWFLNGRGCGMRARTPFGTNFWDSRVC